MSNNLKLGKIEEELVKGLASATSETTQVNPYWVTAVDGGIRKVEKNTAYMDTLVDESFSVPTDGVYRVFTGCKTLNGKPVQITGLERQQIKEEEHYAEGSFLVIFECKFKKDGVLSNKGDFSDRTERAKVLMQVCSYIRQLRDKLYGVNTNDTNWSRAGLPEVILLCSTTTCYVCPRSLLDNHLNYTYKYSLDKSASTAYDSAANKMFLDLLRDDDLLSTLGFCYSVPSSTEDISPMDTDFVSQLCRDILRIHDVKSLIQDLDTLNMHRAFQFFIRNVFTGKGCDKASNRDKRQIFLDLFFGNRTAELTGKRGNVQIARLEFTGGDGRRAEYEVDYDGLNAFKGRYRLQEYTEERKNDIIKHSDQLIEEEDRRTKGDYYTPDIWVSEGYKLIEKHLGKNWNDKYMVWDCAWGTGNLTRGMRFDSLFASTLSETDLNIGLYNQPGTIWNINGAKFQYDFLDDDVTEMEAALEVLAIPFKKFEKTASYKIIQKGLNFNRYKELCESTVRNGLVTQEEVDLAWNKAIEILHNTKLYSKAPDLIDGLLDGRKLLFLINPPYKKSGAITGGDTSNKISNGESALSRVYKINGSQLYSQFMYRILKFKDIFGTDISMTIYCPAAVYSVDEHRNLLKALHDGGLKFVDGFVFKSSAFEGTGSEWPVALSLFKDTGDNSELTYKFNLTIKDVMNSKCLSDQSVQEVVNLGDKLIYTIDKQDQCAAYVKRNVPKGIKGTKGPLISNALGVEDKPVKYTKNYIDNIGGFWCHGNRVTDNNSRVSLWSEIPNQASGLGITDATFEDMISFFAARKLISGGYKTWLNDTDQYMIPNIHDSRYQEWLNESLIYSLFNTASFQTSLREVICQGEECNIYNQFFFLSWDDMYGMMNNQPGDYTSFKRDLEALENGTGNKSRYVNTKIEEIGLENFSKEAQFVYKLAREIIKETLPYREECNRDPKYREYQICNWDCGWYQIKGLIEYIIKSSSASSEFKDKIRDYKKVFDEAYNDLSNKMRPLVYELGFLYK